MTSWSIIIVRDDDIETKVVRFLAPKRNKAFQSMTKVNLSIQGVFSVSLSSYVRTKMTVSDKDAHSIVVVSRVGKLRFTYTSTPSITKLHLTNRALLQIANVGS